MRTNHKPAGQFLRQVRENAGYEIRRAFAIACGPETTYDSVCDLENGRREPTARDLILYQRMTNCDPAYLLKIPV